MRQDLLTCSYQVIRQYLHRRLASNNQSSNDGSDLLYFLSYVDVSQLKATPDRRTIVHMVAFSISDINEQSQNGDTALHIALHRHSGDTEICEPLLQLGASIYIQNHNAERCLDLVANNSNETRKLFERYSPGLWYAVENDDITAVRRLVNLWCSTEIKHNDKTLRELTFEKGTEHIITLVSKIQPSMKLAHAVLARDYDTAKEVCESKPSPNLNFRNLGDMGATPLFYSISQNNIEMVHLLCSHGARIDSLITLQDEEIPIIFAALNAETELDIIRCLIPPVSQHSTLHTLNYRGFNILMHCVQNDVNAAVIRHILQQGHSRLLAFRDQQNLGAREMAVYMGRADCAKAIDEAVHDWYLNGDGLHRKALALYGYTGLQLAMKDGIRARDVVQSMEMSSQQAQFDMQLHQYQNQIGELASTVTDGYLDQVKQLVIYNSPDKSCFHTCLVGSCPQGDGQPVLHKAVIHKQLAIVRYMCETLVYQFHQKVDEVRDQWHRTALHYAFAHDDEDQLVNVLLDFGASEFTVDIDGNSPHVMRDFRKTSEMRQFMKYHSLQDYSKSEPKPWKRPRPPITLIMSPAKHNHRHLHGQLHKSSFSYWSSYCTIM